MVNREPTTVVRPIQTVRSTLLVSSRASLVAIGRFEEYEKNLTAPTRAALSEIIAGTWLPAAFAVEHYQACDALGLTRPEQLALGRMNGERLSGTLLGTLAKLAKSAGTTPRTLIEQFPRFWGRIFDGGSLEAYGRGPKDHEVVVRAWPLIGSAHFRHGLAGISEALVSLVAARLFVRVNFRQEDRAATYHFQWV